MSAYLVQRCCCVVSKNAISNGLATCLKNVLYVRIGIYTSLVPMSRKDVCTTLLTAILIAPLILNPTRSTAHFKPNICILRLISTHAFFSNSIFHFYVLSWIYELLWFSEHLSGAENTFELYLTNDFCSLSAQRYFNYIVVWRAYIKHSAAWHQRNDRE